MSMPLRRKKKKRGRKERKRLLFGFQLGFEMYTHTLPERTPLLLVTLPVVTKRSDS